MTARPPSRSLAALTLATLALAAPSARAEYAWTSPATECLPLKGEAGKVNYTSNGVFNESTTASAKVTCPIPYEFHTFNTVPYTPTWSVAYVDPNTASTTRLSCTFIVADSRGREVYTTTKTAPLATTETQTFAFSVAASYFNGPNSFGVTCTLPKGPTAATRAGLRTIRLYR
jgi:hypothetical protein